MKGTKKEIRPERRVSQEGLFNNLPAAEKPGRVMTEEWGVSLSTKTGFGHKDFIGHLDEEQFQWSARRGLGSFREVRKERQVSRMVWRLFVREGRSRRDLKAEGRQGRVILSSYETSVFLCGLVLGFPQRS